MGVKSQLVRVYNFLTRPPALFLLLMLAFGAGILTATWQGTPSNTPYLLISPLPPTSIPPTLTRPPTPTPTSDEVGDPLDTLYLDIQPQDFARIVARREEALKVGILLAGQGDYVSATLKLNGAAIPAEVRLKGDWLDHFGFEKWSFRVRLRDGYALYGMTVFSLQDPGTRSYLNEWLFLENLRMEDILAVRYRFAHVVLNGRYMGIYAIEEGFRKELLEAMGRREGLIIRYDEDLLWEWRYSQDDDVVPPGVERFFIIDEFQSGRIAADPLLAAQREVAIGLLRSVWSGERPASEVMDVGRMGKFLALADLWNAEHALIWHNLRYDYNPITARLEPVVFDAQPLPDYLGPYQVGLRYDLTYDVFYHDPWIRKAYIQALWEFSQPEYIDQLQARYEAQWATLRAALEPEFGPDPLQPPWDHLRQRQERIRQMLTPLQTTYAYIRSSQPDRDVLSLDVGNLLDTLPVQVVGLETDGVLVPAGKEWVASESTRYLIPTNSPDEVVLAPLNLQSPDMPYVQLEIPRVVLPQNPGAAPSFHLITRIWGLTATFTQTILPDYPTPLTEGPLPKPPSLDEALAQHPYLEQVEGTSFLRIRPGTYAVNGDLVLPAGYGLRLEPGTTLRFGDGHFLFATGPLDFQGDEDAPIVLGPVGDSWGGIVVLEADAPSLWNYVIVERAQEVHRPGWGITGAITFYRSPIRLDHCRITESYAEDGINVIHSRFEFVASEFGPTASDTIDADFSTGVIENCSFHDTGGDAIDVSGSQVDVRSVRMQNIGDKGISVGEGSRLSARGVRMENVRFGVVSKDLSQTTVSQLTVIRAHVAGLAAYIKKPAYGPATLTATDVVFQDVPPERQTLVQTGCWVDLNGVRVWGTDIDVGALYP